MKQTSQTLQPNKFIVEIQVKSVQPQFLQVQSEQPQRYILEASTEPKVTDVLIGFFRKSISQIDDTLKRVQLKYPQMFNL